MYDTVEKIGNSLIQHGPMNDRIYLMKLGQDQVKQILDRLGDLAEERGYSKIFAKVPDEHRSVFEAHGCRQAGGDWVWK